MRRNADGGEGERPGAERQRPELPGLARPGRVGEEPPEGPDLPGAIWHPSPNFWPGRDGSAVDGIVLHGTAGGDGPGVAAMLSDPAREASTHLVIGQDGAVFQLVRLRDSAWGNGIPDHPRWPLVGERAGVNPNRYTVSIEYAKRSPDNSDPLTDAQLVASVALVRRLLDLLPTLGLAGDHLLERRAAGALREIVVGHCDIDSVTRAHCPGTWDWDAYLALLAH
ncbi:MAG: N-acetylmuramoyl-L-alanine amidase [Chloroflexi bacterium]|nr:N-acetylmuramoyl-L-alanine amidase [Chloroflexota bacterium]